MHDLVYQGRSQRQTSCSYTGRTWDACNILITWFSPAQSKLLSLNLSSNVANANWCVFKFILKYYLKYSHYFSKITNLQRIQHLFTQLAWKNVANVLITASILKASKAIDELENPSYKEKQKHYTEKKLHWELKTATWAHLNNYFNWVCCYPLSIRHCVANCL